MPPAEALAEAAAKLAGLQASPQADMRANVRAVYEGCGVVVRMLSETASSCGAVAVALISDSSDPQLLRSRELALVAEEACTRIIQAILRCHQERVRFAMAGLGMVLAHKFDQIETIRQEMGELARLAEEGADLASHAALPGTLQRLEVLMDHLLLSTCRPPAIVAGGAEAAQAGGAAVDYRAVLADPLADPADLDEAAKAAVDAKLSGMVG